MENGQLIPALLPAIATEMILAETVRFSSVARLPDWMRVEQLHKELADRGVVLFTKLNESKEWEIFNPTNVIRPPNTYEAPGYQEL